MRPGTDTNIVVGRFRLEATVGSGGMGVVYRATDTLLGRAVAVKLLSRSTPEANERLIREAQALARLSHPNVITIFEAGHDRGTPYIAMELVDAGTLAGWMSGGVAPMRLLDAFIAAGRGLAAAHAAGLVHRDFKPSNVLVSSDGRIRVADFGVVRATHVALEGSDAAPQGMDATLTRTGGLVGTPAYMSPEQARGEAVDHRSDQFSFCVALYEALYGVAPFRGHTENERSAPIRQPRGVSSSVHRLLARGLSARADERWPSMDALLAALSATIRRRRRHALLLGLTLVAAATVIAAHSLGEDAASAPCQSFATRLAGIWDAPRRAAIEAHVAALSPEVARTSFARAAEYLDGYAQRWVAARVDACQATRVRGEQSEVLLDLRMRCLDRRLAELDRVGFVLADATPQAASRAVDLALGLTDPSVCADVATLSERPPLPTDPGVQARIHQLALVVAEAKARLDARDHAAALPALEPVLAEIDRVGWPPLIAEAQYIFARLCHGHGRYADATAAYERAAYQAEAARDDTLRFRALVYHADVRGYFLRQRDESRQLEKQARAVLERLGGDARLTAELLERMANVEIAFGDLDVAHALASQQLALRRDVVQSDHLTMARARLIYGRVLEQRGQLAEARDALELAQRDFEKVYGSMHPGLTSTWHALAIAYAGLGQLSLAEATQRRVIEVDSALTGRRTDAISRTLNNLGNTLRWQGRYEDSLASLEEALSIKIEVDGVDGSWTAGTRVVMAETLVELGRLEAAWTQLELAMASEAKRGSSQLAPRTLAVAGRVQVLRGNARRGLELLDQAVAASQGAAARDQIEPLYERGRAKLGIGRADDAIADLERVVELQATHTQVPTEAADAELALAQALDATRRDRGRAIELARDALARCTSTQGAARRCDKARRWLAERTRP